MSLSLASLQEALCQPFPPDLLKLLPRVPRKNEKGQWTCLALPYADKRTYEDRLNALAFGEWSTPATSPLVAGNKLIVPVTVVLCGVPHTDYGEAFLSSLSRKGEKHEEENSATEAYSQGFRRACAQFGLGRYLYDLPPLWLPYDPDSRTRPIAVSPAEQIAWIEKLYLQAGLPPRPSSPTSASSSRPSPDNGTPTRLQPGSTRTGASVQRVDPQLLAYLRRETTDEQQQKACRFYGVSNLAELSPTQAQHLSDHIEAHRQRTAQTSS